jgi:D-glycero-D-manno-heptose 1,7-bisphosphate phosphatase
LVIGFGLADLRSLCVQEASLLLRSAGSFGPADDIGQKAAVRRSMKRAVFIERDGVLNEVRVGPKNQVAPLTLEEFQVRKNAEPALRKLKAAGFVLIVTTNQPGLSRGYQSRRELDRMHEIIRRCFPIDDILVCPHDESDHCPCRKPRPGLLIEAAFKWHLNLDHSFVISDKWQDAEAARTAGCTSLLVKSPWVGNVHHDFVLADVDAIAGKILTLKQQVEFA